ncbi:type 2 periplasmic-binding domain-containing protein [Agromyces marinus]|uniref:Uncharacterized protein n=1 Tax=Agromyces marinus TaxID=1389020 RepID=A0ABM8GYX7_9MICO|nr:hypothetical protein [Agromyces marinus]UIP58084.1 hypothetical protein DSM26151_09540 [Agromyces marinus]BDZ53691.1 hypothetical protein GCM10025870_07640 [Agromyces marinus]
MRWDRLFDDLESQLDRDRGEEERALALESERLRVGRLALRDRIAAMGGPEDGPVQLELVDGTSLRMRPTAYGRDWIGGVATAGAGDAHCVVPVAGVAAVSASRRQVVESLTPRQGPGGLVERIGIAFALRDLGRRRIGVELRSMEGRWHGTIDRVAGDHLDLALHDAGSPRRERDVRGYRLVPLERIVAVVAAPTG